MAAELPEATSAEEDFRDFVFRVNGDLQLTRVPDDNNPPWSSPTSSVSISTDWEDQVKIVVRSYLLLLLKHAHELDNNKESPVDQFIENASVDIRDIDGYPVVLILGEQTRHLGQYKLGDLLYSPDESFMETFQDHLKVMGDTLDISTKQAIKILDGAEISIYRTEENEPEIEKDFFGFVVRLRKQVNWANSTDLVLQQQNNEREFNRGSVKRQVTADVRLSLTDTLSFLVESRFHDNNFPVRNPWQGETDDSSYPMTDEFERQVSKGLVFLGNIKETKRHKTQFGILTPTPFKQKGKYPGWGIALIHTINTIRKGYQWESDMFLARIRLKIRKKDLKLNFSLNIPFN